MGVLEQKKLVGDLLLDINGILSEYGSNEKISMDDITVTETTVTDLVKDKSRLSGAIINLLWPSIKSAVVYHYTSMEVAENILSTNIFRLYTIKKNLSQGEIRTLCEKFRLEGYLEKDENGSPKYKSLIACNTYLASFTDTDPNLEKDQYFWKEFATKYGKHEGARLKIEINASCPDFRKMRYDLKDDFSINLFRDLTDCIEKKYNKKFIFKGISKICSFYLPGKLLHQREYRILYRVWQGSILQPKNYGKCKYIEFPIDTNSKNGYKLKIVEVNAEKQPKMCDKYLFLKRKTFRG